MPSIRLFRKHCSDELLLGFADGELAWPQKLRVRKHLDLCWECRARLAELEVEAALVAKAFADTSFLGPAGMQQARRKLALAEERFEATFATQPRMASLPMGSLWRPAMAGIAAVALVSLALWGPGRTVQPLPSDVLAAARSAETKYAAAPVMHAKLRVDIAEIEPAGKRQSGRVEIWSETAQHRSSVRWNNAEGVLRYAVWEPADGRSYILQNGVLQSEARNDAADKDWVEAFLRSQPTLDQMERMLRRWLRSRRWHPIDLASNTALFADADGVKLRTERDEASGAVRLTVERPGANAQVEVLLELDPATNRPRLERIRLASAGKAVEIALTVEGVELLTTRDLQAGVFDPPASPVALRTTTAAPEAAPLAPAIDLANLDRYDAAQVEADYVLHRARACQGETISVTRDAPTTVRVQGMVQDSSRRKELQHEFSQLRSFGLLRIDLQTVTEAAAQSVAGATTEHRETLTASRLPHQDLFEQAFGGPAAVATFTNDAVSLSDRLMEHAWALQNLARSYGSLASGLHPEQSWLLETMISDHLTALRAAGLELGRRFEPVWKLVPSKSDPATTPLPGDVRWSNSVQALFAACKQVDRLVQAVAAGADAGNLDAADLRVEMQRLDDNIRRADAAVKHWFHLEDAAPRSR